jgi:hypothetical protein
VRKDDQVFVRAHIGRAGDEVAQFFSSGGPGLWLLYRFVRE